MMNFKFNTFKFGAKKERGFTLVEITVAIIIIGVLSSVVISNVVKSRAKSRDLQRMTDLKRLQVAIETYRSNNGFYPSTGAIPGVNDGSGAGIACFTCIGYPINPLTSGKDLVLKNPYDTSISLGTLTSVMSPYINQLIDPQENDSAWAALPFRGFLYFSDGYIYKIVINRTPENLKNYPVSMIDPTRCGGSNSDGVCNAAGTKVASPGVQAVALWSSDAAKAW